jgi:hypothetical protein
MKRYRSKWIGAAYATALVALLAGVATASAQPVAAKRAGPTAQVVNVTVQRGGIGYTPSHLVAGRTTLVVHNGRRAAVTFVIVRHSGGVTSLPRYSGMPFIPREEIVGRTRLSSASQGRLSLMFTHGNYLAVTSKGQFAGDSPLFADTVVRVAVG